MHPAKSVIFFTVSTGAGYGLLIALFFYSMLGDVPPDNWFALTAFSTALVLIAGGLLSSTLHLGHPERAWRAFSQWRSSWLSREGVAALVTFVPMAVFAWFWIERGMGDALVPIFGGVTALMSLATVWCTAMIYASLKAIPAWRNPWTLPSYLALSIMSGALLLLVLADYFDLEVSRLPLLSAIGFIAFALMIKSFYWVFLKGPVTSTAASATGLKGKVTLLDAPHDAANYLMKEMGFQIARKHAGALRKVAILFGFLVPIGLLAGRYFGLGYSEFFPALALASAALGIVTERWLFFAEAEHVVTLYYGKEKV